VKTVKFSSDSQVGFRKLWELCPVDRLRQLAGRVSVKEDCMR